MSIPDRRTVLRSGLAVAALGAVGAVTGCTARAPSRRVLPGLQRYVDPARGLSRAGRTGTRR